MARPTSDEKRRLLYVGLFIVVVGSLLSISPWGRGQAEPVLIIVLGSILALFSLVMLANPGNIRVRYRDRMMAFSARLFPASWVENTPDYTTKPWYLLVMFALGCFMIISAVGQLR
jgi:hypothetical protein